MTAQWSRMVVSLLLLLHLPAAPAQAVPTTQVPSPFARQALQEALSSISGEYASAAFHSVVVAEYGKVEPYRQIREESRRGIRTLERLCRKYRVPIGSLLDRGRMG